MLPIDPEPVPVDPEPTLEPVAVADPAGEVVVDDNTVHVLNDPLASQSALVDYTSGAAVLIEDESNIATVHDNSVAVVDDLDPSIDPYIEIIQEEVVSDTGNYISDASGVLDDFNNNADVSDFC
jgi:hypothetical protein